MYVAEVNYQWQKKHFFNSSAYITEAYYYIMV